MKANNHKIYQDFADRLENALSMRSQPERFAEAASDKKSSLNFFAIKVPILREIAIHFCSLPENKELANNIKLWDYVFTNSSYYETRSVPLFYLMARLKDQDITLSEQDLQVVLGWANHIENWGHCDLLGNILARVGKDDWYSIKSHVLGFSRSSNVWKLRLSMVSLVDYVGKNSTYVEFSEALPLIEPHIKSKNPYLSRATGWVLREFCKSYDHYALNYVQENKHMFSYGVRSKLSKYL